MRKMMTVKVLRAFLYKGEVQAVGKVLEVPEIFGRELCAGKKAERAEKPAPKPEPKPETKAEPKPRGKSGSDRD